VRLEGLGQLKNPMTTSGIEPATFRFVSIVSQPTMLPHAHYINSIYINSTFLLPTVTHFEVIKNTVLMLSDTIQWSSMTLNEKRLVGLLIGLTICNDWLLDKRTLR
jgi:hypothetical protein